MSENENFFAEQNAEVVADHEIVNQEIEQDVGGQNVSTATDIRKKFNVLTIVALVALGVAFVMGIVGICIDWLYIKSPTLSGADTLKELIDANKLFDGQYFNGLEAILAFGIISIIASCFTAVALVLNRFFNIKAVKYVSIAMAVLLIVSSLLTLILTFTCANTEICTALKNAGTEFVPAAGAWLLTIFSLVGGIIGIIGVVDNESGQSCAKTKEFARKRIVSLKRKPQRIPFLFLIICSVFYLLCLNDLSRTSAVTLFDIDWFGLCVFVNTLFSILVLVLFLNAFPKYPKVNKKTGKKHKINILMLVLGFIFIATMIFLDAFFIHQFLYYGIPGHEDKIFATVDEAMKFSKYLSSGFLAKPELKPENYNVHALKSYYYCIAHIVLLGVTILMYALLPLFKMLLLKINTKKEIEDNDIKEVIDTED